MKRENVERMERDLRSLSFLGKWSFRLKLHMASDPAGFSLPHNARFGEDKMEYRLFFEQRKRNEYMLSHYIATLRKAKQIPHLTINGVDTAELEKRFKRIKWSDERWNEPVAGPSQMERVNKELEDMVYRNLVDLARLARDSREGETIRRMFQQKYLLDTPFEKRIPQVHRLKMAFDAQYLFRMDDDIRFSAKEAYNLLDGRAVSRELKMKEHDPITAWYRLNKMMKDGKERLALAEVEGGRRFDAASTLQKILPRSMESHDFFQLVQVIKEGDSPQMFLSDNQERTSKIRLEAVPEAQTVRMELTDKILLDRVKEISFRIYGKDLSEIYLNAPGGPRRQGFTAPEPKKVEAPSEGPKLWIDETILSTMRAGRNWPGPANGEENKKYRKGHGGR